MKNNLELPQLLEFVGAVPPSKSLPAIKGRKIKTSTRYISGLATALSATNGELVLPSTVPSAGVTNLPKGNMLPAGQYLLVTGVRMLFDTTTSVNPLTAIFESKAPANFYNGEIIISQNGEGSVFESSISDVTNKKASTGNDADFRDVTPFIIRPEAAYSMAIKLASAAAADQAYKLELRVVEFIDSDK